MPIDQMQVAITRPLEEEVNSAPGLDRVVSITSRGSAEIDLFFTWNVDMFQTLQQVNGAIARVQPMLPSTAQISTNRLTFAAFPIMRYSVTSDTIPQNHWRWISNAAATGNRGDWGDSGLYDSVTDCDAGCSLFYCQTLTAREAGWR